VSADEDALRHLYDVQAPALLTYLLRLTRGDQHRSEDLLQETLVRAWEHPEARGPDGFWRRAWLFTVARRLTIDQVRAVAARPPELFHEWIDTRSFPDGVDNLLDAHEIRAAIATLPERLRETLIEVYIRDRSAAEAGEVLGVPVGTIKSRTFYALRALRDALAERGFSMDS
jgi:RNA polymerase sigma-70 factor (ECF subfamily)